MAEIYYHWLMKPINHRDYMPNLLRFLKLNGKGIEVGTAKGDYSELLLLHSNLLLLYSIDHWHEQSKEEYSDIANISQAEHDNNKTLTQQKLNKFGDRSKILNMTSEEASKLFKDEELDFVYVDANHTYKAIKEDLGLWYSKVKKGGVFAGHDYLEGELSEGNFGVKTAVDEMVKEKKEKVFVCEETWPSWYIIKGEI